jgi:hypothetical protein
MFVVLQSVRRVPRVEGPDTSGFALWQDVVRRKHRSQAWWGVVNGCGRVMLRSSFGGAVDGTESELKGDGHAVHILVLRELRQSSLPILS